MSSSQENSEDHLPDLHSATGDKSVSVKPNADEGDVEKFSCDANQNEDVACEILNAAKDGDLAALRCLLDADPQSLIAVDKDGYTALHRACYGGHNEIVKELLIRGANIRCVTKERWQPLHCACHWNFADCAALLIHAGANVNAKTKGGQTPLHLAVFKGGLETVMLLLDCPLLDPRAKNSNNETALDIARRKGPFAELFEALEDSVNIV